MPTPPAGLAGTAIITLKFRKPGARRKARAGTVNVVGTEGNDPDSDSTSVSIELLRSAEYGEVVGYDNACRNVLKVAALPAGKRLAPGSFLVPLAAVERLYAVLDAYQVQRAGLVGAFIEAYPRIVADARERLRDAFDDRMFPDPEVVREAFSMSHELEVADREAGVRAASASLSPAFVARELEKARESGSAMLAEIRDGLRVAFAGLVDAAAEALTPGEDGKPRKFSSSHVEKIQSFLAAFADRNVAGDGELGGIIEKAREVLAGVTPESVKDAKDRPARERLAATLGELQSELEAASIVAPRRRIVLDEAVA